MITTRAMAARAAITSVATVPSDRHLLVSRAALHPQQDARLASERWLAFSQRNVLCSQPGCCACSAEDNQFVASAGFAGAKAKRAIHVS